MDRIRLLLRLGAIQFVHALDDVIAGQRAFRGDEFLAGGIGLAGNRLPHLEGDLEIALHDTPRTAMARATLDHGKIVEVA